MHCQHLVSDSDEEYKQSMNKKTNDGKCQRKRANRIGS